MTEPVEVTQAEFDLLTAFRDEVYGRAEIVDPDHEQMWFDLAYGFFMGRGMEPEAAYDLAVKARYQIGIA